MLVPDTIQAAATAANAEVVLAWLDAGNDVNCNGGSYSYNLLTATAMATPITEANVALARELLRRGADPRLGNNHSYGQWVPLHAAARGQGPASAEMVALLLDAGADPDALMDDERSPLAWALSWFPRCGKRTGYRPALRAIIFRLLRAGASLDHCTKKTNSYYGGWYSAEEVFQDRERSEGYDLKFDLDFIACRELVARVTAAGSWREYIYRPRKQVLALRSLALRGRAYVRRESPDAKIMRFIVNSPNEVAWKVLGYWRAGLGIMQPPAQRTPQEWVLFCMRQSSVYGPDNVSFEERRTADFAVRHGHVAKKWAREHGYWHGWTPREHGDWYPGWFDGMLDRTRAPA